jgi:hypothetical protein
VPLIPRSTCEQSDVALIRDDLAIVGINFGAGSLVVGLMFPLADPDPALNSIHFYERVVPLI